MRPGYGEHLLATVALAGTSRRTIESITIQPCDLRRLDHCVRDVRRLEEFLPSPDGLFTFTGVVRTGRSQYITSSAAFTISLMNHPPSILAALALFLPANLFHHAYHHVSLSSLPTVSPSPALSCVSFCLQLSICPEDVDATSTVDGPMVSLVLSRPNRRRPKASERSANSSMPVVRGMSPMHDGGRCETVDSCQETSSTYTTAIGHSSVILIPI